MNEARLRELLRDAPVPDERAAEERGWRVVRAAFVTTERSRLRPRRGRLAIAVAVGVLLLAIGLSPAGAKVADLVHDVVHPGEKNARPELTSLPTSGRLLVTSPKGSWVVAEDGGKRRLGSYDDAAWSPNGLFVAVTKGRELTAVEPDGTVRWSLPADHPVSDPAWAPSGIRVAYRAGNSLRVVAGDGTGDRRLARVVAPTAPAWAPQSDRNILGFVGPDERVRAVDVESGRTLWRSPPFGGGIESLQWSSTGHLLVMARSFFVILDRHGRPIAKGSTGGTAEAAAFAPNGKAIAIARRAGGGSELALLNTGPTGHPERRLLARPGRFTDVTWSPDGTWILFGWRDADQWLFIRPADRKVVAVAGISRQFAPGARATVGFPGVAGWCCRP
jgi:dipeptidyl aminopeptidase/acylaminoacyl peptidase